MMRARNSAAVGGGAAADAGDDLSPYILGAVIGRGGFGVVYEALNVATGENVAIKRLSRRARHFDDVATELHLLQRLQHANIVRFVEAMPRPSALWIVLELVEGGSLASAIQRYGVFNEPLAAMYLSQALAGLVYLHSEGVVHRDVKAANLLVTKEGIVKLADFGIADDSSASDPAAPSEAGSPYWMAPEAITTAGAAASAVTTAADIWSVGATTLELLTGKPPYWDMPQAAAMFHIVQDSAAPIPTAGATLSQTAVEFLSRCLCKDPADRGTALELSRHPWIVNGVVAVQRERDLRRAQASTLLVQPVQQPPGRADSAPSRQSHHDETAAPATAATSAAVHGTPALSFLQAEAALPARGIVDLSVSADVEGRAGRLRLPRGHGGTLPLAVALASSSAAQADAAAAQAPPPQQPQRERVHIAVSASDTPGRTTQVFHLSLDAWESSCDVETPAVARGDTNAASIAVAASNPSLVDQVGVVTDPPVGKALQGAVRGENDDDDYADDVMEDDDDDDGDFRALKLR